MNDLKLELTIQDTNLILEALGTMPYLQVYKLIEKIQDQATHQLQPGAVPRDGSALQRQDGEQGEVSNVAERSPDENR
ncbi:MAG: hypothetical protein KJ065_19315 [Anaerolineae bacterium]|nr:hypothetical protein [Anaerolineae bacterium]